MVRILIPLNIERYKAIVFDFDGVVVESNQIKRDLFFEIWDEFRDDEVIQNSLKLKGSRYDIIQRIYNQLIPKNMRHKLSYDDYILKYKDISENTLSKLTVNNIVEELLKKHYKTKLLFLNSATPSKTLKTICKNLNIEKCFEDILGVEKEKQQNFYDIFKKHGLRADEILFYGDMKSDEAVANSLGIDFIAVDSIGSDLKK